ncbi:DUF255 domain-containing protein [Flavobacteriales bacterium]|nr:DUF255 domain-containing protein [Flavobacteriales bacterium]
MKHLLLVLGLFLGSLFANAQVNFFEGSLQEAVAKAKDENKFLFVDCYTDWCYWCKVADSTTFQSEVVANFMNKRCVAIKLDMERGEGRDLGMKYRVFGYPAFLVFNSEGQILSSTFGYIKDDEEFLLALKSATAGEPEYRYKSHINDKVALPYFYTASFKNADSDKKVVRPKQEEVNVFLMKQEDLTTEVAWNVMRKFELDVQTMKRFVQEIEMFRKLYGDEEVDSKIVNIASGMLEKSIEKEDESSLTGVKEFIDTFHSEENREKVKLQFNLRYAEKTKNWRLYNKIAQSMIDLDGLKKNLDQVNSFAWTLYLKCDDQSILMDAIVWMQTVVRGEPNYAYLDTYAALLYKTKQYDAALKAANEALMLGEKQGQEVTETKELIGKIKTALAEK